MPTRRTSTRIRNRLPPQGQTDIQSFARAVKPGATTAHLDGKELAAKNTVISPSSTRLPVSPSKKRKLNEVTNGESEEIISTKEQQRLQQLQETPSKALKFSSLSVSTPRSSRIRSLPSISQSSSFSTTRSRRSSPPTSPSRTSSPIPSKTHDECTNTESRSTPCFARPAAFDDLLDLNSSFLTALSLHFAHNGPYTPADLRELLPSIERIWRKRKVVPRDLQRLVRIWESENESLVPRFRIANYGLGKVCLERVRRELTGAGNTAGRLDENELQKIFEERLDSKWRQMVLAQEKDAKLDFVEQLGLAQIHDSLTPLTEMRKGQQRLQDLKGGIIKVKTAKLKAQNDDVIDAPVREATTDRQNGLLDRIKTKKLLQSKLPAQPSKDELLRQSAAERVEDVARVLALLRPSGSVRNGSRTVTAAQRKPYKFDAIIQNIKDSTRNPISSQEVAACLDILAQKDVAGDWIDIVTVNRLKSVVLRSCHDVSPRKIGIKVTKLKSGWRGHSNA